MRHSSVAQIFEPCTSSPTQKWYTESRRMPSGGLARRWSRPSRPRCASHALDHVLPVMTQQAKNAVSKSMPPSSTALRRSSAGVESGYAGCRNSMRLTAAQSSSGEGSWGRMFTMVMYLNAHRAREMWLSGDDRLTFQRLARAHRAALRGRTPPAVSLIHQVIPHLGRFRPPPANTAH